MKENYFQAADLLHSFLRIKSNCYDENGEIIRATYIVAIDDDVTSMLYAVKLWHEVHRVYGYFPILLCVGGKGLMSKHTHQKSEAELLAYVALKLGVPSAYVEVLGLGKNTGDNVLAVAKRILSGPVLWCVTQRLSLRLERTQAMQAPEMDSFYYVIEESLEEVMKVYNGKGLCDGQMLLHELASILNRCKAYSGTFQKPLEFDIPQEVKEAAALLERDFRLKLPLKTFKSYCQFVQLFVAILLNKRKMRRELEEAIKRTRFELNPSYPWL